MSRFINDCLTDFMQHAIVDGQFVMVVFLVAFNLRVKKLCWSPLLAELLGCAITRTIPIAAFMVFVRFGPVLFALLLFQALFCE